MVEINTHHSRVAEWITTQAYSILHQALPLQRNPDFPVVLVDLSRWRFPDQLEKIEGIPGLAVRTGIEYTDRKALALLVKQLAEFEPRAIGVDIDFSPITPVQGGDGEPPKYGIEFFEECDKLTGPSGQEIPVFLGVMRTLHLGPAGWLGSDGFSHMAASIARLRGNASHVPVQIELKEEKVTLGSLSKKLSEAYFSDPSTHPGPVQPPEWASRFLESHSHDDHASILVSKTPVDYHSTLPSIESSRIHAERFLRTLNTEEVNRLKRALFGKLVIIGYGSRGQAYDTVCLPGEDTPMPGVYLHACAVATMTTQPLFELNSTTGIVIGFLGAFSIFYLSHLVSSTKLLVSSGLHPIAVELVVMLVADLVVLVVAVFLLWFHILWVQVALLWVYLAAEFLLNVIAPGGAHK